MGEKLNEETLRELDQFKERVEGETITDPESHQRNGADSTESESENSDQAEGDITAAVANLKALIDTRATYFRVKKRVMELIK